jgi:hypothetical protein
MAEFSLHGVARRDSSLDREPFGGRDGVRLVYRKSRIAERD